MFEDLSCILKGIEVVLALFWKKSDLVYINSNKKIFDQGQIDSQMRTKNTKWIVVESKGDKLGWKFIRFHFFCMKAGLFQIIRNICYTPHIVYAGYASVPFAMFDGYVLGDNHDYTFFDTTKNTNTTYKIDFSKKRITNNTFSIALVDEVDILISSSATVNHSFSKSSQFFEFTEQIPDKVSSAYQSKVFYFVSDLLDACRSAGVKRVHLYCSSRQPVSFIVGMAIQSHHPEVVAYEFDGIKYTWGLSIQKAKLVRSDSI